MKLITNQAALELHHLLWMLATAWVAPRLLDLHRRRGATKEATRWTKNAIYKICVPPQPTPPSQPPKTIYQFMLNCGLHCASKSVLCLSLSMTTTTTTTTSLTWQITKFICFLIQNIYCQTQLQQQQPRKNMRRAASSVETMLQRMQRRAESEGQREEQRAKRSCVCVCSNCLKNGRRTLKFSKCIYYGTKSNNNNN